MKVQSFRPIMIDDAVVINEKSWGSHQGLNGECGEEPGLSQLGK
jgi:hypothetical protein